MLSSDGDYFNKTIHVVVFSELQLAVNQSIACINNINQLDSKITQQEICKGVDFASSEKCG